MIDVVINQVYDQYYNYEVFWLIYQYFDLSDYCEYFGVFQVLDYIVNEKVVIFFNYL